MVHIFKTTSGEKGNQRMIYRKRYIIRNGASFTFKRNWVSVILIIPDEKLSRGTKIGAYNDVDVSMFKNEETHPVDHTEAMGKVSTRPTSAARTHGMKSAERKLAAEEIPNY